MLKRRDMLKERIFYLSLAFLILVYIIFALASFNIRFYETVHRVTYPFIFNAIIAREYDPLLVMIPSIICCILLNSKSTINKDNIIIILTIKAAYIISIIAIYILFINNLLQFNSLLLILPLLFITFLFYHLIKEKRISNK
jgi:hypothetical protein